VDAATGFDAKTLTALEKEGWPIISAPVEAYTILVPDSGNPDSPFANKKVREAIEYAIDRESVVKALGYGRQQALYQMTPNDTYAYIPTLQGRRYDPAKAKQLLTEAGYPNGFKTTIINRFGSDINPLVAASTFLKEVGIEAVVDNADVARFVASTQNGWKNALVNRSFRVPPDWLQFAYTYVSPTTTESKSMARPANLQPLLEKALTATDMAAKKAASQAVVQAIYDDAMVVPFWANKQGGAMQSYVRDIDYHFPWGANRLWSPADIWLDKK
jgi:ABC-type transport system substrate-binding protein